MSQFIREQFEQWANDRYNWHLHEDARDPQDKTLSTWDGEKYGNRIVEGMWQAFQGSREVISIDLGQMEWLHHDEARDCIESHGIKVLP